MSCQWLLIDARNFKYIIINSLQITQKELQGFSKIRINWCLSGAKFELNIP